MLLSRIKCLKTKELQRQAKVHGHSTSLWFPAWPSPSAPAALPWPQTQLLLPTLNTRQCFEPLNDAHLSSVTLVSPPMPRAPLSPSISSYPRSTQPPAPVPAHPCCCLLALFAEPPHHPSQLALKWSPENLTSAGTASRAEQQQGHVYHPVPWLFSLISPYIPHYLN